MNELSRSSEIRNVLDKLDELPRESDNDSDIGTDLDDIPNNSDDELFDFSSGSGEEYHPEGLSDSSDSEDSVSRSRRRPIPNSSSNRNVRTMSPPDSNSPSQSPSRQLGVGPSSNWVRVYPPEDPIDVTGNFQVRNTGGRNLPPRNSLPINYFYLFFSDFNWSLLTKETNTFANSQHEKKKTFW